MLLRHLSNLCSVRSSLVCRCSLSSISKQEYDSRRVNFVRKVAQFELPEKFPSSRHIVIIPSSETQYSSLHVPYPYRQDSYFRYLTGITEPNVVLVFEISSINSSSKFDDNVAFVPRLFVESRNSYDRLWDGPNLGVDETAKVTGIKETMSIDMFPDYLKSVMPQLSASSDFIWFSSPFVVNSKVKMPINRTIYSMVSENFAESHLNRSQLQNPNPLIDELRLLKSPSELALMREAVAVTSKALKSTMSTAYPGIREAEIAARFEFESRLMGSCLGYPAVVAGGSRANIIHYLKNSEVVKDGELILTDVGCEVEGYTADLTRTWPVNGRFSKEQRLLYEILIQVQTDVQMAVNRESNLERLYSLMLTNLVAYLREEKILKNCESESSQIGPCICPHHVGHYLGLDVHDTASISSNRKFEPGMVFPLEPAIYFSEDSRNMVVPKEFRGIGLRLEDDFVVNPDGKAENLCNFMPFTVSDIENLVGTELSSLQMTHINIRK